MVLHFNLWNYEGRALEPLVPQDSQACEGEMFEIDDLSKTSICPLCRVMRRELKRLGIFHLKVLYSKEKPVDISGRETGEDAGTRRSIPGSVSFVPPVAGLLIAGEVIRELSGVDDTE